jgi:DNA sulfur modification protein DndE
MLDAYSNVFSSPGTRTTGNGQHNFLITGPGWTGTVPAGMKEIPAPTNTVWIIGRTQVNSKEDGEKVVIPLQRQYKLTPLSAWGKTYTPGKPVDDPSVPKGFPNDIVKNMSLQEYLNYANDLLAKYPPPAADQPVLEKFASIGVGAGKKFDINALKADKATLEALPNQVMTGFLQAKSFFGNGLENGWSIARNGIGTYGTDYAKRAAVAFGGLGANLPEDAIYPGTSVDESGNTLNGSGKYVLHFDKGQEPPAKAFWSLTLYDKGGHFVDNPINRYAIGDRSHLKTNPDGSTDIYIQNVSPGKDKESNWLPAPAGEFNLLLRVYNPKPAMLDGSWKPGPVKKVS